MVCPTLYTCVVVLLEVVLDDDEEVELLFEEGEVETVATDVGLLLLNEDEFVVVEAFGLLP
jgi:hypothetical protein